MKILELVIRKLTSGRFILTVISGIGFLYALYKNMLPDEAVVGILTMIFVSYFQRGGKNESVGTSKDKDVN